MRMAVRGWNFICQAPTSAWFWIRRVCSGQEMCFKEAKHEKQNQPLWDTIKTFLQLQNHIAKYLLEPFQSKRHDMCVCVCTREHARSHVRVWKHKMWTLIKSSLSDRLEQMFLCRKPGNTLFRFQAATATATTDERSFRKRVPRSLTLAATAASLKKIYSNRPLKLMFNYQRPFAVFVYRCP